MLWSSNFGREKEFIMQLHFKNANTEKLFHSKIILPFKPRILNFHRGAILVIIVGVHLFTISIFVITSQMDMCKHVNLFTNCSMHWLFDMLKVSHNLSRHLYNIIISDSHKIQKNLETPAITKLCTKCYFTNCLNSFQRVVRSFATILYNFFISLKE